MKMKNIDKDGKRCMNNKEEQKNALGWMSPDLADAFMMREWFELWEKPSEPDIYFL
jgi:hypothetical protein